MPEAKEIPKGFDSWMHFYNHISKTVNLDFSNNILRYYEHPIKYEHPTKGEWHIKIKDLKAKCFDELNSKRISSPAAYELFDGYKRAYYTSKNYDEILGMINIMTLPKR